MRQGASGAKASRPEWDKCLARLDPGDTLVVVKLDRMGRSVRNLLDVIMTLKDKGVALVILDQQIDTSTAMGKCFFTVMAAFAEFERDVIIERTMDGLANARAQGHVPPGCQVSYTPEAAAMARKMRAEGTRVETIAEVLKVSRATAYRMVKA